MYCALHSATLALIALYCFSKWSYKVIGSRSCTSIGFEGSNAPPTLSYSVPILKSTIALLYYGYGLFERIRHEFKNCSIVVVEHLTDRIYVVADASFNSTILKSSTMTVTHAYGTVLRSCFGMSKAASEDYMKDTSGSTHIPLAGGTSLPAERIGYSTHANLQKLLLGPELPGMMSRFETSLLRRLENIKVPPDGLVVEDLYQFFEQNVGSAVLESVFGTQLLATLPDFTQDLWVFDKVIMQLASYTPRFLAPTAYRVRNRLISMVKSWHTAAERSCPKDGFDASTTMSWGPGLLKSRREMLLSFQNQSHDSVASTDLALIWASVTNVVPSSATLLLQIMKRPEAVDTILQATSTLEPTGASLFSAVKLLETNDLVMSLYAETLRFGVQIHVPRNHPHSAVKIGGKIIPKDKLILVSTWLAHNDEEAWNTSGGKHPLSKFWPQRFLTNWSVPLESKKDDLKPMGKDRAPHNPSFSLQGLENSWIPFGGGLHACPGRFLAKHIMLASAALLIDSFEIEIETGTDGIEFDSVRFGFGVRRPRSKVFARLRPRCRAETGA